MQDPDISISPSLKIPFSELEFQTSRSGGPGGQNVNKLETRVEVFFNIAKSPSLPEHLRRRLLISLASQVDSEGVLRIVSQQSRSQWKNKKTAVDRLARLLMTALAVRKKRIATQPSSTSREKRLKRKKARGETKRLRKVSIE